MKTVCLTSSGNKTTQIEAMLRYHYVPLGCLRLNAGTITNAGQDIGHLAGSGIAVEECNKVQCNKLENSLAVSYKVNIQLS